MTITLVKESSTTTLVAGQGRNTTGDAIGPEDFRCSDAPGVVTHDFIGAARETPELVRCNHGTVSFGVTRTFADVASAAAYMASDLWTEGASGSLKFDSTTVFDTACVTSRVTAWVGCTVKINYTIEG